MGLSLVQVVVLVFSVVVHEVAHGWAAYRLGDSTAYRHGRLTLNPLPHIDPVGSIIVPLFLSMTGGLMFGWAKPVPVRPGQLNDPRNDHPKVAMAGPLSNLLMALAAAILLGVTVLVGRLVLGNGFLFGMASHPVLDFFMDLLGSAVTINVVLAVFNLVPLPPLDGSWVLARFLSPEVQWRYVSLARFGMLLVVGFLVLVRYTFVGRIFGALIMLPVGILDRLANAIGTIGL